jgi:hypothetical protein
MLWLYLEDVDNEITIVELKQHIKKKLTGSIDIQGEN